MLSNPDAVDGIESLDDGAKGDDEEESGTDRNNLTSDETTDLEKGSVLECSSKMDRNNSYQSVNVF